MGNSQDIQEIKNRADIVTVISRYISLKKAGRNYVGLCPFHGEKTPSFNVNPSLGIFKCFGCGVAGDVIKFIQDIEHLEFHQAIEKLAEEFGIQLHENDDPSARLTGTIRKMNEVAAAFYSFVLTKLPQGKDALAYAIDIRKLTKKTIVLYKVGYAPQDTRVLQQFLRKKGYTQEELNASGLLNDKGNDKYVDRLMFPIFDNSGHIVGFSGRVIQKDDPRPKYLNSAESVVYKKRFLLFGLFYAKDHISKQDMAIITEGQLDTISSHQCGVMNVVAPLGTGLTETQVAMLSRYTKNIAFSFDNDAAGKKSLLRGVEIALRLDLRPYVVTLPEDVKDIDELVQKRPDEWKDRAAHPIEFFAYVLGQLRAIMKKDMEEFEKRLRALLAVVSVAPELRQQLIARQIAETLGLTEQGVLATMRKNEPIIPKSHINETRVNLTTPEYLLGVLITFPLPALLMGKVETAQQYFMKEEYQRLFVKIFEFAKSKEHLITSVLDKKTKQLSVSWELLSARFLEENTLEWAAKIGEISQQSPELSPLLERLGLDTSLAQMTVTDDVIEDFFKAWGRLRRQAVTVTLELLRKRIEVAEATGTEEEVKELQLEIQQALLALQKIEKNLT